MLLALARIVTTKVVLRPEGHKKTSSGQEPSWDFLFHQSGMIGSAILFGNASCTRALPSFPPQSVTDSFAVSFVGRPPQNLTGSPDNSLKHEGLQQDEQNLQQQARTVVKGIAKLKIDRAEFDKQAAALRETNVVYKNTEYKADLLASWVPDITTPQVPQIIVDSVVAVPLLEEPGKVLASGPGDATAAGDEEQADLDVEAAKAARTICAFSPDDIPGASESSASLEVASLMEMLEDLENTSQRSVAAEIESSLESGACLVDDAGRERILEICTKIRNAAAKLSHPEKMQKLQAQLQKQPWENTNGNNLNKVHKQCQT